MKNNTLERRHHLDRRCDRLGAEVAAGGDADELLSTSDVAELLSVSGQWLEIGRSKGYGPPFIKLGPRRVRYRRQDLIEWLAGRRHRSTAEYMPADRNHDLGRPRGSRVVDGKVVVADEPRFRRRAPADAA
ncbi:MAG TPA: helix-turn-helix domain-containing protein [Stellaceae bacterium]|nr:helix-turn-helix domain-containing protein [Stellaceae bacterium]